MNGVRCGGMKGEGFGGRGRGWGRGGLGWGGSKRRNEGKYITKYGV